jgi:hypothetical protein
MIKSTWLKLRSKFWTKMLWIKNFMWYSTNILIEQIRNISCLQIICWSNNQMIKWWNHRYLILKMNLNLDAVILSSTTVHSKQAFMNRIMFIVALASSYFYSSELTKDKWNCTISEEKGSRQTKIKVSSLSKTIHRDIL